MGKAKAQRFKVVNGFDTVKPGTPLEPKESRVFVRFEAGQEVSSADFGDRWESILAQKVVAPIEEEAAAPEPDAVAPVA